MAAPIPIMPGMQMGNYPPAVAVALFYRACGVVGAVVVLLAVPLWWMRRRPGASTASGPGVGSPAVVRIRTLLAGGLGGLWFLDGLLQAQPLMVTRFVGGFLQPLMQGQPLWVQQVVQVGARLWGLSPIWWNVGAAYLQVGIGLGLLLTADGSRARRLVLWVSLGWAAVVWSFGEAFGSVFAGGSALAGSPGSVALYGVVAAALLYAPANWERLGPVRAMRWGMAGLFALWFLLQVWPANQFWVAGGLAGLVRAMAEMPQPGWLAAPLAAWAASLQAHPVAWNTALAVSAAALGSGWALAPRSRVTWAATVLWTLAIWYWGQDFGVLGGMGTDPNTGAILLLVLWSYRRYLRECAADRPVSMRSVAPAP